MENQTFEDFLNQYFIDLREDGGVAITKDNVEDMFDNWLQNHDIQDIIDLGELYGKYQFLAGKENILLKK
jgi:hypothetical protein